MNTKYTVIIDRREGGNDSRTFGHEQDAIAYAKAECRWESTLYATVIAETEYRETEIYNEAGSFA